LKTISQNGFFKGGREVPVSCGLASFDLTWFENAGHTIIQADVNGDATADIWIKLSGTRLQLNEFDFFL
jgi:hypothetical protein